MDMPPPIIERIMEIPEGATLDVRVGDKIIYSVVMPSGPARVAVEYMVRTTMKRPRIGGRTER